MARQNYNVDTSEKKIEVYGSFGGGMVTQAHPEKLNDDQFTLVENAEILAGGIVQARGGYVKTNESSTLIPGATQGRFRYQLLSGFEDIVASGGKLYKVIGNVYTQMTITGLTNSSFQTTRQINAVQDRGNMYFATGSGIVKYDGTTAALLTAYTPDGLEALYVGTNGLAANPDTYLTDITSGAANVILGVVVSQRYGIVNKNLTITAYIEKIAADNLEYKFEYKNINAVDYRVSQDWSTVKSVTVHFSNVGDYILKVSMRKVGTTVTLSEYLVPRYKIKTVADATPEPTINFNDLKLCNKIFIHYDRLFIYGDTGNPDFLYISQLNNFAYFPRTNIIKITDPLRGSLQAIVRYKNYLVCWTDNSIQLITGTSPSDFAKQPVHTTLGTKLPDTVSIMKNYIAFVGNDNGVYYLKSFNYASDEKLNVERIDDVVKDSLVSIIKTATSVDATVHNNQYYLLIQNGSDNYVYRYYYEYGIWVRDKVGVSLRNITSIDNDLYLTSIDGGKLYKYNPLVFRDDVSIPYLMKLNSKDYTFNIPHHRKKLKQYQLLSKLTSVTTITVSMFADNNLLTVTPVSFDPNQNSDAQKLNIPASGRFRYVKVELSAPVNEALQFIGFGFIFKANTPK